jgi:ketosteroid isomerase-like protein
MNAPIANAEADILAQERIGLDRWSAGDAAGYVHSAVDEVTYFDDIGAFNRIDGVEAARSYLATLEIPPHQYEVIDPKVQVYGETAILTLHYHGLGPDGEVLSRWKATSVYRHEADGWHTVHAHWSLIKEQ